jgi:hypothetical protein
MGTFHSAPEQREHAVRACLPGAYDPSQNAPIVDEALLQDLKSYGNWSKSLLDEIRTAVSETEAGQELGSPQPDP